MSTKILQILNELKDEIADNIVKEGLNASGATIKSMRVEQLRDNEFQLLGRQAFDVLQYGRKGGKAPYKFSDIITQWIKDKGFSVAPIHRKKSKDGLSDQERGIQSLSYAIAYNIKKRGTKLHREGGYNDVYTTPIKNAEKKISEVITTEVEGVIIATIKTANLK